jgi:hypothetical protein|tara:strand:+ start:13 stop:231 length:219 start_codon:yes stop_codon:yes gene_type:complete
MEITKESLQSQIDGLKAQEKAAFEKLQGHKAQENNLFADLNRIQGAIMGFVNLLNSLNGDGDPEEIPVPEDE